MSLVYKWTYKDVPPPNVGTRVDENIDELSRHPSTVGLDAKALPACAGTCCFDRIEDALGSCLCGSAGDVTGGQGAEHVGFDRRQEPPRGLVRLEHVLRHLVDHIEEQGGIDREPVPTPAAASSPATPRPGVFARSPGTPRSRRPLPPSCPDRHATPPRAPPRRAWRWRRPRSTAFRPGPRSRRC